MLLKRLLVSCSLFRFSRSIMLSSRSRELACADVYLVPMFTDNYGYILVDRETKYAGVIDPGSPEPVIKALQKDLFDVTPKMVLCTHKHGSH